MKMHDSDMYSAGLVEYRVRDQSACELAHVRLDMLGDEVLVSVPTGDPLRMPTRVARALAACLVPATHGSWEANWRVVEVNLGSGWRDLGK